MDLLEEHINNNIVKVSFSIWQFPVLKRSAFLQIGKDYYRQIVGIPQGSVISTLLCSFFYGDMERRFVKFTEDLQSVNLPSCWMCYFFADAAIGVTEIYRRLSLHYDESREGQKLLEYDD